MFGYVRIFKPQMRVCEYEAYRAVYCTLCRELGKNYGPFARMLLNYDFTFVAMLYMAVRKETLEYEVKSCVYNPLKKCGRCKCNKEPFAVTGAMIAEMFYYKACDNVADSGFLRGIAWRLVRLCALPMKNKAKKRYPRIDELTAECMRRQEAAEKSEAPSIDESADPTARLISSLARDIGTNDAERRILADFGYYFGRWIYLIDAFDDIEKDIRRGSFNPFVILFGLDRLDAEKNTDRLREAREYANECLNMTIARALKAFDLLDTGEFAPIFENILELGISNVQRMALHEKELQNT